VFARVLDRLTYANVVATLALFAALGGSAYAVATIGSADVKNRSLRGKDLRPNTVKGKQVREASLRRVPRAKAALTAANAQLSQNAVNAENAQLANRSTDSDAVGGLGVAALEKSSRTQFARATGGPTNAEPVLLEWPAIGIRISAPLQTGCGDEVRLRIDNTRTGGADLLVFRDAGAEASVGSESTTLACSGQSGQWDGVAAYADEDRTLFFECRRLGDDIRCLGVRSEP
jgi:hypothetical protein